MGKAAAGLTRDGLGEITALPSPFGLGSSKAGKEYWELSRVDREATAARATMGERILPWRRLWRDMRIWLALNPR